MRLPQAKAGPELMVVRSLSCPRDETALEVRDRKGIEVDQCPGCGGMWLDHHELDDLEDQAFDSNQRKGMRVYAERASNIGCPVCSKPMRTFNYRAHNLQIDQCPEECGFWLDPGEEKAVADLMRKRVRDLRRSSSAQVEWEKTIQGGPSLFDKVKDFFRK